MFLSKLISSLSSLSLNPSTRATRFLVQNAPKLIQPLRTRAFSGSSGFDGFGDDDNGWDIPTGGDSLGGGTGSDDLGWDNKSMWSTGFTTEHFDGVSVGRKKNTNPSTSDNTGSDDTGDVMSKLGPREVAMVNEMNEFFVSHDREFHVASLKYNPGFKVMPEGWEGTIKDIDEVHYEISKKEDDMLYEEFVQRFEFNKMKWRGEVKCHKYSRRRSTDGWKITIEKLGPRGKRGAGGGWKFVSLPDGSSRPLNEMEKVYVKRETPRRRRKILACSKGTVSKACKARKYITKRKEKYPCTQARKYFFKIWKKNVPP